jgi:hypothetical protein
VITIVPVRPSEAAVIVAEPVAIPRIIPLPSTRATAGLSLDHTTARPGRGLLRASMVVAVSCSVSPATTLDAEAEIATAATAAGPDGESPQAPSERAAAKSPRADAIRDREWVSIGLEMEVREGSAT